MITFSFLLASCDRCMACAPSTFQDGAGYTAKDIISSAIQSCNCMGYQIDDIDLSALGEGDTKLLGQACYSGNPSPQAEPTAVEESSASDSAGTLADDTSSAQEDVPTSSVASATFIPATRSPTAGTANDSASPATSSTSASGTGTASIVQAQQILALSVAIITSAMFFSHGF